LTPFRQALSGSPRHPSVLRGFDALPDIERYHSVVEFERFELTARHAANRGICLSTNRKNRVSRVPATNRKSLVESTYSIEGGNPGITPATSGTNGNTCSRMKPKR
jgi:hypothetical protein